MNRDGWVLPDPRMALDDSPEAAPSRAMLQAAYRLEFERTGVEAWLAEDVAMLEAELVSQGRRLRAV